MLVVKNDNLQPASSKQPYLRAPPWPCPQIDKHHRRIPAAATALLLLLTAKLVAGASVTNQAVMTAGGSKLAYSFGYVSASEVACGFSRGAQWNELESNMRRKHDSNSVPSIRRGFQEFQQLLSGQGMETACKKAMNFFGPEGINFKNVLSERK